MSEPTNLEVGQPAPSFTARDHTGKMWKMKEIVNQGKSIILYFYPKDSTPGCTTQACDFRDNIDIFENKNLFVFGISKDSEESHQNFVNKQSLNFPLLLDEDMVIHNAYGVWREKKNYGKTYMGCARSTFVIDPDGILRFVRYNVKAKGHVEMLIRELTKND